MSLEDAIQHAGNPVNLLWQSQAPPSVVPRLVAEFSNWRDEQLAWRRTAVIYDQSHHMVDLNLKGPDALRLLKNLAINSMENFPIDKAKQFVAVNHEGYIIGDNILFHLDDDEYRAVGIPPSINWIQYHAETGNYDVEVRRDETSLHREGPPELYRYQLQGPGAMEVLRDATGEEPPKLKFFSMGSVNIAGKLVRTLRHGMAGEPGVEIWGPWDDQPAVQEAILEAGVAHGLVQVGARAYHTNALESGWLPRPLPAIYTDEQHADYRRWLTDNAYEAVSPLGGSFYSENIEDYYFTPHELGYGRLISFDHDYIGRKALEAMPTTGGRKKVTLVWNGEDVGKAYASMFQPGTGAKFINLPMALYDTFHYDRVESNDQLVGVSTWTGYSANERAMLSIAVVDEQFAEPHAEVVVIWGEETPSSKLQVEDHVQVKIRATVQPAPIAEFARTAYRA